MTLSTVKTHCAMMIIGGSESKAVELAWYYKIQERPVQVTPGLISLGQRLSAPTPYA
jgi:hypothetical protein